MFQTTGLNKFELKWITSDVIKNLQKWQHMRTIKDRKFKEIEMLNLAANTKTNILKLPPLP
jgi:hypothetical protein